MYQYQRPISSFEFKGMQGVSREDLLIIVM